MEALSVALDHETHTIDIRRKDEPSWEIWLELDQVDALVDDLLHLKWVAEYGSKPRG